MLHLIHLYGYLSQDTSHVIHLLW